MKFATLNIVVILIQVINIIDIMSIIISKVINVHLQVYYATAAIWNFAVKSSLVHSPPEIPNHVTNQGNFLSENSKCNLCNCH